MTSVVRDVGRNVTDIAKGRSDGFSYGSNRSIPEPLPSFRSKL